MEGPLVLKWSSLTMSSTLQAAVVTALIAFMAWFYTQRKRRLSFFNDLGIPGPPPKFLSGNLSELVQKGTVQAFKEWIEQYGNFFGFYNGAYPVIIVKDLDLIKNVLIKDFANFHGRGVTSGFARTHHINKLNIQNACGQRWKEMRSLLSPAFTTRNMKKMIGLMEDCTLEFLGIAEALEARAETFEARELFQRLTADIILRSAFGLKSNVQQKPADSSIGEALYQHSLNHFEQFRNSWRNYLIACFPEFSPVWNVVLSLLARFHKAGTDNILNSVMEIVKFRRANPKEARTDILQLMLNAEVEEGAPVNVHSLTANYDTDNTLEESKMSTNYSNKKKRFLTNEEIVANGHVFFVAGFETTGTTLSFMSYLLAKHQDIQDRLREEVLEVLKRDGSFTYDNAFAMNYLDQVISETLRLYAPIVGVLTYFGRKMFVDMQLPRVFIMLPETPNEFRFVTRSCDKDYMHNNVTIPAGTSILVPVHHLGRDPDFWDEPDKFDPDRFGGDRKHSIDPMVYQPFGQGPRNCIGLRFAQMEIKLTMAKLLAKYRIVLDERHMKEEDLEVGSSFTFAYPQNGVWLKLQRIN